MATNASYASITAGSTSLSNNIDCNHPYYLHPSDNPGMQITTIVLNENNYNQWQRSMELALSSKLKLRFVDGSYTKPPANSPLFMHWLRCNNMITSWMLNSVTVEIRNSIVYLKSAREIWLDLEVHYAQSNVPKLFHLRKEIAHLTQGTLSVSAYFTKFRTIHDELECLTPKPRCTCTLCTCAVNTKLNELEQSVQLTQFLMGLNETFTAIRGQILMMKPLSTLSQSYAMLLQEKSQREVSTGTVSEAIAMAVKQSGYAKPQVKTSTQKRDTYLICDFCHMTGHLKDKCYFIHGYPSWHKLFGKPKPKPRLSNPKSSVMASVVQPTIPSQWSETNNDPVGLGGQAQLFSKEELNLSDGQYKQLIQLLQKSMLNSSGGSSST